MIARYAVPFFVMMAFVVVPLVVFFLCRYLLPRRWGKKVGISLSLIIILFAFYGMFAAAATYGPESWYLANRCCAT